MTRARLTDGTVVELEKDCDCVTHEGPHWLHMDDVDKSLNVPLRARALAGESLLAIRAYAQVEQQRLAMKLREMESRNIAEILR